MASYADMDQTNGFKVPALSLEFAKPLFKLMAKSPGNTVFAVAMTAGLGFASVNALFLQNERHPSPFFAQEEQAPQNQQVAPVTPAPERPVTQPTTTQSTTPQVAPTANQNFDFGPVTGNPDAFLVQSKLYELGYFKEKVDGYYGPKTAAAIREFEAANGLTITGAISQDLIAVLQNGRVTSATPNASATPQAMPQSTNNADPLLQIAQQATAENTAPAVDRDLVLKVQKGLASLGYEVGEIDGIPGEATATAIRRFETFYNYDQTGEVTPELIDMLKAANAKF
jgi:peptidoglycan hydrolase-like protein with peptidoglycan-binding domain